VKYFLSIILSFWFLTSSNAQTTILEPLKEWAEKRQKWSGDPSELAYVATRCGALYSPIGNVFSTLGKNDEDKVRGSDFQARGLQLTMFGHKLAQDQGWDTKNLLERHKTIMEAYYKIVGSNRTIHNNMFYGFIEDDLRFCIEFEKIIRSAANKIK
jgi:hypothetical protein